MNVLKEAREGPRWRTWISGALQKEAPASVQPRGGSVRGLFQEQRGVQCVCLEGDRKRVVGDEVREKKAGDGRGEAGSRRPPEGPGHLLSGGFRCNTLSWSLLYKSLNCYCPNNNAYRKFPVLQW